MVKGHHFAWEPHPLFSLEKRDEMEMSLAGVGEFIEKFKSELETVVKFWCDHSHDHKNGSVLLPAESQVLKHFTEFFLQRVLQLFVRVWRGLRHHKVFLDAGQTGR